MFGWWSLICFLEAAQLMRPAPKENEMTRSFEPIIKHKQMSKQMMDWTEYWKRQRWMLREPTRTNPVNLFFPLRSSGIFWVRSNNVTNPKHMGDLIYNIKAKMANVCRCRSGCQLIWSCRSPRVAGSGVETHHWSQKALCDRRDTLKWTERLGSAVATWGQLHF